MTEIRDLAPGFAEELFRRFDEDALTKEDRPIVRAMMEGYVLLGHAVKEKNGKIQKLLKMIFGAKTQEGPYCPEIKKQKGEAQGSRQKWRRCVYGRRESDRLSPLEGRRPVSGV